MADLVRHCPGCRGYTTGWKDECPGIPEPTAVFAEGTRVVTRRISWFDRLRILAGRPVVTAVIMKEAR
jgi:hypothetical protein